MMGIIWVGLILGLILFGFRFFVQTTMMRMPNTLGLTFQPRFFRAGGLVGKIDGVPVQVWQQVHSNNLFSAVKRVRVWTDVLVEVEAALPEGLRVSHEGVVAGLGKAVGMQDIVVGYPPLDKLVVIKGKNPDEVKAFFARPGIAEATFNIFDRYNDLVLANNQIKIRQHAGFGPVTEQMIVSIVQFVCALQGRREVSVLAMDPNRSDVAQKRVSDPLLAAGLDDASFEDNARFVEQEIARRKAAGSLRPSSFDQHAPQIVDETPIYDPPLRSKRDGDDVAPPSKSYPAEHDGSW